MCCMTASCSPFSFFWHNLNSPLNYTFSSNITPLFCSPCQTKFSEELLCLLFLLWFPFSSHFSQVFSLTWHRKLPLPKSSVMPVMLFFRNYSWFLSYYTLQQQGTQLSIFFFTKGSSLSLWYTHLVIFFFNCPSFSFPSFSCMNKLKFVF